MKKEFVPYTIDAFHSTIDYKKLIEFQVMTLSETTVTQEEQKQKVYFLDSVRHQNQRYSRNRESSGVNPKNK